jgi:alginate O-acetyltransferase complex protein AlgI
MSYASIEFLLFVLVLVLIYYIFPKKHRYIVLLIGSLIFYYLFSGKYIIFILLSSVITYFSGKLIEKYNDKRKLILTLSILLNLSFLLVLKYNNFFGDIFRVVGINIPYKKFILPIGISYYTLETISYLTDIYRKRMKAETNYLKVLLFLVYFPQIVEGPIANYSRLSKTLFNTEKFNYDNFVSSFVLIGWGFIKKLVIADRAGIFVSKVFENNYGGILLIVGILLYTLQIYADFSGCIDIVSGVSELFGVKLDENFKRPFFSKSIQEFWRRWHITLGTWLKEYIFYPISLSKLNMKLNLKLRKMKSKYISRFIITAFPLFFVWFFNGMWHGASFKYVVYGLYYYVLMMIGILLEPVFKKIISIFKINTEVWSYKFFQAVRTILIVCFGMFLFRVDSFKQMGLMIHSKATASLFSLGLKKLDFALLMVGILVMLVVGVMQEFNINIRKELQKQNLLFKWLIYYIMIFSIIIFGIYGKGYDAASFIYGGF